MNNTKNNWKQWIAKIDSRLRLGLAGLHISHSTDQSRCTYKNKTKAARESQVALSRDCFETVCLKPFITR